MTVDSALERSALERKDRDELLTIAKALGGKPASRAKKADIVDVILELTGVGSAGGAEAAPEPSSTDQVGETDPGQAGEADGDTDATGVEAASGGEGAEPEPAVQRQQPQRQGQRGGRDGGGREDGGGRGDRNGQRGQGGQGGTRLEGNRTEGDREPDPNQRDEGNQRSEGPQGEGDPDGDDSPNKRRRRRGRNRDRGEMSNQSDDYTGEPVEVEGHLDLRDEGYGFLRLHGFLPSRDDVYISVKQARQFGLRKGDHIKGASRPALRNEKNPALLRIDAVNGGDPEQARSRRRFEDLTPLFPDERLRLEREDDPGNMTARIIDLLAPIGKGQRGLIVSPPKAGKTTIMKEIARSIERNSPEVHLFVLLVDERPEEVTDMRRWLKGERSVVIGSTFDRPTEEHTQVAELAIERAKRLVEDGADVVIILDGITRLARAYNLSAPTTGRVMSGGIDTGALYPPKKFFGAARNIEEGGSLTILATALVETGSRMDEVIFEEFKGTGNMELRLDRRLAERRVYPAIDVDASSTRHEELLFQGTQLQQVWKLRRVLSGMANEGGGGAGLNLLTDRMKTFKSNAEFLKEIGKTAP